jgi:disulfide bond formation protein DsbB
MNNLRIFGLILFYIGIIGGIVLAIYSAWLLIYVSRVEQIKIRDIILVKKKPSEKWINYVKGINYSGFVLGMLLMIGIILIIVSF